MLLLVAACLCVEYHVKWDGDDRPICHPMIPCKWEVAVPLFEREDVIVITDSQISTPGQLSLFQNLTAYTLSVGGAVASTCNSVVDGSCYAPNGTDFFLELSPFNESHLFGFTFANFTFPVISVRGKELFQMTNCTFQGNSISFDFPMMSFANVTTVLVNVSILQNSVEASSILGLNYAIAHFYNSSISNNIQLSRGIPLMELTGGGAVFGNSTIENNVSPYSPLFGSWMLILLIVINSTVQNNFCGSSSLIVGDAIANVSLLDSTVIDNRAALLHSMTMSSLEVSGAIVSGNTAAGQALIFAPRSKIDFLNKTIISSNIADSIISFQLSNQSSVSLVSVIFRNNICSDTAFALYNSESRINSTVLAGNTVVGHSLLSLKISNLTIDDSSFEENWCSGEGNLIDIEDGSLDVKTTKFLGNRGFIAPIRISIDSDQRFPLSFAESVFSNNYGRSAGSVYFSHKQVPIL
jgi:hypothetical protein